ncbi:MAG: DUF2520 domain-containing protein [Bacteroidetes bacterium]|nr:DUF2520 domain-containing protein [Bacteroidota bacterium]
MSLGKTFQNGIVILGAGNVATHLSLALKKSNINIRTIYSKTAQSAKSLASKIDTNFTTTIDDIPKDADLYIIAVKDEVIIDIIRKLQIKNGAVVHTAGSVSMNLFQDIYSTYGVLYPLQTFSVSEDVDFSEIPIFIEANDQKLENDLLVLAKKISNSVKVMSSEKRTFLHLAAVFACNFSNHMYSIASEIIDQADVSFDVLKPLIKETTRKAIAGNPLDAQTGPALRNDQYVIQKHIEMLNDNEDYEKIYRFVSDSIFKLKQKKEK